MQISRGIHTEVSAENVVWADSTGAGRGVSGIGEAEGESGNRGTSDDRSRAHAGIDPAEVFSGAGDRLCEGQKRHSHSAGVCRTPEKLHRAALLGARLLGID